MTTPQPGPAPGDPEPFAPPSGLPPGGGSPPSDSGPAGWPQPPAPASWPQAPATNGWPQAPAPASWPQTPAPSPWTTGTTTSTTVRRGSSGRTLIWIAAAAAIALIAALLAFAALPDRSDPLAGPGSTLGGPDGGGPFGGGGNGSGDGSGGGGLFGPDGNGDLLFQPDSIDVDERSAWVSDFACGLVVHIDTATNEVAGIVDIGGGSASGVTIEGGSVWVGNRSDSRVVGLDPDRIVVDKTARTPGYALGLASGDGEVWTADPDNDSVDRIDATTGAYLDSTKVGSSPHHVVVDGDTVWVTNNGANTVSRINAAGTAPVVDLDIAVGNGPLHVALGAGSAWVTDGIDGTVHRLNATTGAVEAVITVGILPHALAFASGQVWVGSDGPDLWRIDPATNQATRVSEASFTSIDMVVDGTTIWVADAAGSAVVRFDAATGQVAQTIDLGQLGTCDDLRQDAVVPPPNGAV